MESNEITNDKEIDSEQLVERLTTLDICNNSACTCVMHSSACACSASFKAVMHLLISDPFEATPNTPSQVQDNPSAYQKPVCKHGIGCFSANCGYDHPPGWHPCQEGFACRNFYCQDTHPYNRTKPCRNGSRCKNITMCRFLHPKPTRQIGCPEGDQCRVWQCHEQHSSKRLGDCQFGEHCYNPHCRHVHPANRQLCPNAAECVEFFCTFSHPSSRSISCNQGNECGNFYCAYLHPFEWDPCEAGNKCTDVACPHAAHPADRILNERQEINSQDLQPTVPRLLKSVEQRNIEQQKAQLPILSAKDEFCRRLKQQRVLVVRAETGSGKSTQLPQYAAEHFGGLVVCTQPRVIAAISLARRVAQEYDGISVGRSVGYRVGYASVGKDNNQVPGTDILFMTDGALIYENQEKDLFRNVRVLIIDEAHERSVHTDIVIGIAKALLETRQNDFYVVISSATVNRSKFLNFFQRSHVSFLNVPGRLYDVSSEYKPKPRSSTIVEHAVSTLLELYDQHEGHTLVFLPGVLEIQQAIVLFNSRMPNNSIALPLYSSLSLEEQNQVLQFDGGSNGEVRMVVFCTNIAETSVTINNVRLIIDSGLMKEAHFDSQRRLTVMSTVHIPRSSAKQRRGRAGRTAPGHCVRLYNEGDLTRRDIHPAILRSSLDSIVLQIICLGFDPKEFPFIDPPNSTVIQISLDLLKGLSCIDTDYNVTRRGELFNALTCDPRYSAFLVDTYLEHGPILELVANIVAILTVQNFRADTLGAIEEEKVAAQNRVIDGAKTYDSDLLYLVSIFKEWRNSGSIDPATSTCQICHVRSTKQDSCPSCRAAYSRMYLLNNRSLCTIENLYNVVTNVVTSPRWGLTPGSLADPKESDIIGTSLCKHFPERWGHFLETRTMTEDATMIKNRFQARLSNNSVFSHRRIINPHFIAMSVVELSNNRYSIDLLHPFRPPSIIQEQQIKTEAVLNT